MATMLNRPTRKLAACQLSFIAPVYAPEVNIYMQIIIIYTTKCVSLNIQFAVR